MRKIIIISMILCFCLFSIKPITHLSFAQFKDNSDTIQNISLTQEQAKELLIKYNDKVDYIYQGDENDFEALKSKNLSGYVFLPDVETDIGFFVDKNTSHIYFFHPSGYLELAQ